MRVAVPCWGELVAPCIGHCTTMAIYVIGHGRITERVEFPLRSQDPFDRIRLLREQRVDLLICGGVQDVLQDSLRASGIRVIPWVSGSVDRLLELFLAGHLLPREDAAPSKTDVPSHTTN